MNVLKRYTKRLAPVAVALALLVGLATPASAATLSSLSLTPADPTAAASTTYTIAESGPTATTIKCIVVKFDTSAAFGGGSLPSSMALTSPALTGSTAVTAASWGTGTVTTNQVKWTYSTGQNMSAGNLVITGVTNPNAANSYYAQVNTFSDTGCSSAVDTGTLSFAITANTTVSVTVDASFSFTVGNQSSACNSEANFVSGAGSATGVALGRMAVSSNVSGGQALTVSGNSGGGFSVYVRGNSASGNLTRAGGGTWTDASGTYASPATFTAGEKWGYTYKDSTSSTSVTNPGAAAFIKLDNATTNKVMGSGTSSSGTGCISFDAQTGTATPAGNYSANVIYTAVPVF